MIGVPNEFAREWIEKRLASQVAEALSEVLGDSVDVRVVVDERAADLPQPSRRRRRRATRSPSSRLPTPAQPRRVHGAPAAHGARRRDLNPRYVFDRFVTGPHNEYAAAVAHSVAESPATAYNPVFMYADTGLGKTHLIQAIAHEALKQHPDLQIRYVTGRALHRRLHQRASPTRTASRASSRPTAPTTCCSSTTCSSSSGSSGRRWSSSTRSTRSTKPASRS